MALGRYRGIQLAVKTPLNFYNGLVASLFVFIP